MTFPEMTEIWRQMQWPLFGGDGSGAGSVGFPGTTSPGLLASVYTGTVSSVIQCHVVNTDALTSLPCAFQGFGENYYSIQKVSRVEPV